jgi:MFS family permease
MRAERPRFAALFFLHAHALGMWSLATSNVLKTHGLEQVVPYVFAANALAAIVSPLVLASLADQRVAANRLLRWLATGTAIFLALTSLAIERGWGALPVLALLQLQALCSAPMWGLSTSVVLARLETPEREFGPIRVWATIGWMSAGWATSFLFIADASTRAGFVASAVWLSVAAYTFTLPDVPPLGLAAVRDWRDLLGLRALSLLAHRDHRVVFLAAGLFSIPLAAFYPFTALHLSEIGVPEISAALSLGQVTEIVAMYALAAILTRVRLKWVFLAGIGLGLVRYLCFAMDSKPWLLAGIALHGLCFTFFFITAQLYLEKRIDPQLRARAQALVTLMSSGLGTFIGSIGSGWWREACRHGATTDWPRFWLGQSAVIAAVFVFFAAAYRGAVGGTGVPPGDPPGGTR